MTEESSEESYARPQNSFANGDSASTPGPGFQPDIFGIPAPSGKQYPRRIPHLGHAAVFFAIAFALIFIASIAGGVVLHYIYPHRNIAKLLRSAATDARFSIPIQAAAYGIIALVCIPVFSLLWHKPFGEGIHWHNRTAWTNFFRLVILGLAIGALVAFVGDYLPMPKNPPITQDMMKSATGAWLMLIFGITAAPLLEELAFRGFLLPGLLNAFRWFSDHGAIPESVSKFIGIPISIVLTSIAFAFMHSPQVSHAWGPLLLIGLVSVVLCVIRLAMNSVMASVLVHAAYNFTLFAGVLYQTSGFRHLERLTG